MRLAAECCVFWCFVDGGGGGGGTFCGVV